MTTEDQRTVSVIIEKPHPGRYAIILIVIIALALVVAGLSQPNAEQQ